MAISDNKNFWPLVGNRAATEFLEKSAAADNLAGTYIFCGPKDLGKTAAAVFFSQALLCQKRRSGIFSAPCGQCSSCQRFFQENGGESDLAAVHGDFHVLKRNQDKKNISVEEVREFIKVLSLSSFLGSYKIGLIKEAEDLNQEGANALLKTLEEPRQKVIIILTVSRLEVLPKTILSRGQILRFAPVGFSEIQDFLTAKKNFSRDKAMDAAKLSLGRPALAVKFAEDKEFRDAYSSAAECFLKFFDQGIFRRFKDIDFLLSSGGTDNQLERVSGIIGIWRGLGRDFLLSSLSSEYLAQNYDRLEDIRKISRSRERSFWLRLLENLDSADDYLRANVNPHSVLEKIAAAI
jgi:DNA polymerase-3 subunit delta'